MCDKCNDKHKEDRKISNKVYNSNNRDKDIDSFYKTNEWEDTREDILTKYNYIDLYDYFINNRVTTANTVHHIVEIKDNYELRLDEDNLIPLSPKSHIKIHMLYRKDKDKAQSKLKEILYLANKIGLR
jgi:5-methylcytosine-specific restriction endonuclease McrA